MEHRETANLGRRSVWEQPNLALSVDNGFTVAALLAALAGRNLLKAVATECDC